MAKEIKENQLLGYMVDVGGNIWGVHDESRLKNAPWYKRILAKVSKRYKSKFIDLIPFDLKHDDNGTYNFYIAEDLNAEREITITYNENG